MIHPTNNQTEDSPLLHEIFAVSTPSFFHAAVFLIIPRNTLVIANYTQTPSQLLEEAVSS